MGAWLPIFLAYFSTQTVVQALGIVAGLLLVRYLPVHEFALYTLGLSVVTFLTFVTDLGTSSSLLHFYRQSVKDGEEFQAYLAAVYSLRRVAFLAGAAVVAVAFPLASSARGFGTPEIILVGAGILLSVWFQIGASLRLLDLRLLDRFDRSYRAEMAGSTLRLLLVLLMVAASKLRSWLAIFAGALATLSVYVLASPALARQSTTGDVAGARRRVLRYLLPTLPSALYFAIQTPLMVWLAATFGGVTTIAQVGALGRLGLLVGLFSGLTGIVFLPRLARLVDERQYRRRYLQFGALLVAVGLGMVIGTMLFPELLLFILGPQYRGLHLEVVLVVAGAALALLDGYAVSVNFARSWTRWQSAALASLVGAQIVLGMVLPLDTAVGVLKFNFASAAGALVCQLAITLAGFVRPRWVAWR